MIKKLITMLIISTNVFFIGCNNVTPDTTKGNTSRKEITIEEAKDIALKHAKLSNDKVTFIKTQEDMENNTKRYDIEFYSDNIEYDYEINAETGEIIEFDKDIEDYTIPSNPNTKPNTKPNKAKITEEEAKSIALKHAKLSNDKVKFDKIDYDIDNNYDKYDINFYYNNEEYSYEINAQTGEIISHEVEKK